MKKILIFFTCLVQFQMSSNFALAQNLPFPENWEKILECDNGAAVVDVNTYERRHLQLVVREPEIVRHLQTKGAGRIDLDKIEAIFEGKSSSGVFSPEDFIGFIGKGCAGEGCYYKVPSAQIFRSGNGITLRWVMDAHKECVDYRENDYYCAEYRDVPEVEIASWKFQSCN